MMIAATSFTNTSREIVSQVFLLAKMKIVLFKLVITGTLYRLVDFERRLKFKKSERKNENASVGATIDAIVNFSIFFGGQTWLVAEYFKVAN